MSIQMNPQLGPYERGTDLQGIFTYLLIYIFISMVLRKECPSVYPKSGAPNETDVHSRGLLNISVWDPSKQSLPRGPPH
jgi:hypothetical protein